MAVGDKGLVDVSGRVCSVATGDFAPVALAFVGYGEDVSGIVAGAVPGPEQAVNNNAITSRIGIAVLLRLILYTSLFMIMAIIVRWRRHCCKDAHTVQVFARTLGLVYTHQRSVVM